MNSGLGPSETWAMIFAGEQELANHRAERLAQLGYEPPGLASMLAPLRRLLVRLLPGKRQPRPALRPVRRISRTCATCGGALQPMRRRRPVARAAGNRLRRCPGLRRVDGLAPDRDERMETR